MKRPGPGNLAPDFAAAASDGSTVRLAELRGKRAVLAFFPRVFTSG